MHGGVCGRKRRTEKATKERRGAKWRGEDFIRLDRSDFGRRVNASNSRVGIKRGEKGLLVAINREKGGVGYHSCPADWREQETLQKEGKKKSNKKKKTKRKNLKTSAHLSKVSDSEVRIEKEVEKGAPK